MDYRLDDGAGGGTRLGMVVLSTDETLEFEARQVFAGRNLNLMHARIPFEPAVTPETLHAMKARIADTAALLPGGLRVVAYGCTSASVVIGPDVVAGEVRRAHPGVAVTDPITAVGVALSALNARRIALVTPYLARVARPMRDHLAAQGTETVSAICFGEGDDRRVARIAEASTLAAVLGAGRADGVEAVFASCTNLRAFGLIEEAEAILGVPVISSNLAMIWHMLRLAGVDARGWGPGRLFAL